jgi:hypothetical protein
MHTYTYTHIQVSVKIDKARDDTSIEPLYVNSDASKPSHTTVSYDEYGVPTVDRYMYVYLCMYVCMYVCMYDCVCVCMFIRRCLMMNMGCIQ